MALFYKPSKKQPIEKSFSTEIISLDYQGLGVARYKDKTWFIKRALPGEKVQVKVIDEKAKIGQGYAEKIFVASNERIIAPCEYYTRCGGCQMQHMTDELELKTKQHGFIRKIQKLAPNIKVESLLADEVWHYRRRARLSIWFNKRSKEIELGYREYNSQKIVSISTCKILAKPLDALIPKLRTLFQTLSGPSKLGHIELYLADNGCYLLLRYLGDLAVVDKKLIEEFSQTNDLNFYIDNGTKVYPIFAKEKPYYSLPDNLKINFIPGNFIQANAPLNKKLVATALDWLNLEKTDRILDLFCGVGNFSLPIAHQVTEVVGVEGSQTMVDTAMQNAKNNNISNAQFYQQNLAADFLQESWAAQGFNKLILDPPRAGALFALQELANLNVERIVYVSCNPATLIRDLNFIIKYGYAIKKSTLVDMFPQTGHLESITLLVRC